MYQYNAQAAKEADTQSAFLKESGKYKGRFTRAEKLISTNKGTHGIGFTFETDDKRSTRFDIWTLDAQQTPLTGFKMLQAIWTCLKLPSNVMLQPRPGKVERYDWDTRKTVIADAQVFTELVGKPIGLILRSTEYEKMREGHKTGDTGWRLELVVPFEAATELTSSEILARATKPEKLGAIVATLADRPLKNRPAAAQGQGDDGYHGDSGGMPADAEQIPF